MRPWLLLPLILACTFEPREKEPLSHPPDSLSERLNDLQARLLWAQERTRFWEELRARSKEVTELVCQPPTNPEPPLWAKKE